MINNEYYIMFNTDLSIKSISYPLIYSVFYVLASYTLSLYKNEFNRYKINEKEARKNIVHFAGCLNDKMLEPVRTFFKIPNA